MPPGTPKRIALVWAAEQALSTISVRYERYLRGFRALGHEPFVVCTTAAAAGFQDRFVPVPDLGTLRDARFWSALKPDAAVVVTWLTLPDVVAAIKGGGCPWVVSIADSDGKVGARVFPGATFVHGVWQHRRSVDRLRAAKFWVQRYLFQPGRLDQPVLDSAGNADAVAVGSALTRDHLGRFFAHHRHPELAAKLAVVPYPVDECYLVGAGAAPRPRPCRLVAVGRWDDPQKDAGLLAAAIQRVAEVRPDVSFAIVGRNGGAAFGALVARHPQVSYLGVQPPEAVADLLDGSRALLMSSRWEGAPVVLNEALCRGCTLVGPGSVVSLDSFCGGGRYGTVSRTRSPAALAAAVLDEMRAWDEGRRDPEAIAATWRPRFDPRTVCQQLLEGRDTRWD